jgi:hypothetical protein
MYFRRVQFGTLFVHHRFCSPKASLAVNNGALSARSQGPAFVGSLHNALGR